jgi:hypothetical protein
VKVIWKITIILKAIFLFIILAIMNSCSVQKRIYMQGYRFDVVKNSIKEPSVQPSNGQRKNIRLSKTPEIFQNENDSLQNIVVFSKDSCQDLIVLLNGDEINATIKDSARYFLEYYDCKSKTTTLSYYKEIFMVKKADGRKIMYGNKKERELNPFSAGGFYSYIGFFPFFFTAVAGPILASVGLIQATIRPKKYNIFLSGLAMLSAGLIFLTALWLVVLLGTA